MIVPLSDRAKPRPGRWTASYLLLVCIGTSLSAADAASGACSGPQSGDMAQLSGVISDASAASVGNARVVVACGGFRKQTTANPEGRYTLSLPPGSYDLRVQKDGFAPAAARITILPGQTPQQEMQLVVAGVANAVTVTAGGFEQLVQNAPASVTVVTREDLQVKRVSDLAQALNDVEGVDVGQDVGKTGGLTISMRGMPSDYTLMLIDGKRQNPAGNVTPNGFTETATSFMPPVGAIERIEVVRGPMSALYGSDAMGGVVNVITRKVGERWTGTVTVDGTLQGHRDYGDTGKGSFYLTGPLIAQRLGLALRGSAFRREAAALKYENVGGEQVPITSLGLSPTRSDIQNAGGRLNFLANANNEFYVDFDTMSQAYDNSERQLGTVGPQGGYAEQMRFRRHQLLLAHVGRFRFGQLDTSLSRNATDTTGRTIPPRTPGRIPGAPRTLESTNTVLDSKLVAALGSRHILSVGGQWWDANMVDAVAPNPYDHRQAALFAEDEWRLLRKLSVTVGMRYDNHNAFGGNISPRGYLVYNASRLHTLKGGISRGFKTPQLNQLATGIVGFGGREPSRSSAARDSNRKPAPAPNWALS